MAIFDIISSTGYETNTTTLVFPSGTWNLYTIGSNIYVINTTLAGSTPTLISLNASQYNALKLSSYDIIIVTYVGNGTLYRLLINVSTQILSYNNPIQIATNVISVDCVAINNFMRLIYVNSTKLMVINDYAYPTDLNPNQHFEIQLSTEDNYQYHLINLTNPADIIVYYIDTSDNLTLYENAYTILTNIIEITPPIGTKYDTYSADLTNVDIDYNNLTISASEGILNILNIDSVNKLVTFTLNSNIRDYKTITFDDSVDTFNADLYNNYQNSAPSDINISNTTITEGSQVHTNIGTLSTIDADADNTFTYNLENNALFPDNQYFTIEGNILYSNAVFNYETKSNYTVNIKTTDNNGGEYTESILILVNDVHESPSDILLSQNIINENTQIGTIIGVLSSIDGDKNEVFTYTFENGTGFEDNQYFLINGNILSNAVVFNYELRKSYIIRIKTTDKNGLSFIRSFNILVQNVNEAPTILELSNKIAYEGVLANRLIGYLSSNDPDGTTNFTYTLYNGAGYEDNQYFEIVTDQLRPTINFDYEQKSSYIIRIQVTDVGGLSFTRVFNVLILNVNESPINILLSNLYIIEKITIGSFVAYISTEDPDMKDTATYTLVSGTGSADNTKFSISGNELKTNKIMKNQYNPTATIRIRSTDSSGLYTEKSFTINNIAGIRKPASIINAKRPQWPYRVY